MASPTPDSQHDVIIIGGGPSGSTAAIVLARAGLSVLVVERQQFPRFHIGESLLPKNMELFRLLGLEEKLRSIPHTKKYGVELALGHETTSSLFSFEDCLGPSESMALNVERAAFDTLLLNEAESAGATVLRRSAVREVLNLADDDVRVTIDDREVRARYLVDASGQATYLGKRLGIRHVQPDLKKVSYFGHFANVFRHPGKQEGYPAIVMMEDGWFWIIPIDATRTSVGLVMKHAQAKAMDRNPAEMLEGAISRCPVMTERMTNSTPVGPCHAIADFSYRCEPYAGEGYFLVGDAATFVDPVFSTGVCMGMMSAWRAAEDLLSILCHGSDPERARRGYIKYIRGSSSVLFRFVRNFYRHSFREVVLCEVGPLDVHRAVLSILAGNVFPKPRFRLVWRLWMFEAIHRIQRYLPAAPKRERVPLFPSTP
ncbi:MAG: NAD(P)/FAD-dependent oxidoreductase [Rhodothermales bacterium]